MTVNVARPGRRRAGPPDPAPRVAATSSFAIGEINQTLFDCPSCSRPLAIGSGRCPGCRSRLIGGVPASKATMFATAGLALGLLAGSSGGLLFGLNQTRMAEPALIAGTSTGPQSSNLIAQAPGSSPAPASPTTTGPSPLQPPARIPPLARSALVQSVGTNERLAMARLSLESELSAERFDASAAARILRSVSADSVFGKQLAARLLVWSGSTALGRQLDDVYGSIHDTAAAGLMASVRNQDAYRLAARSTADLLAGLAAVDGAVRSWARAEGLTLPVASAPPSPTR